MYGEIPSKNGPLYTLISYWRVTGGRHTYIYIYIYIYIYYEYMCINHEKVEVCLPKSRASQ